VLVSLDFRTRPLTHSERGRLGGRKRWDKEAAERGATPGPRVVRLDQMDHDTANVIRAIMRAREAADEAVRVRQRQLDDMMRVAGATVDRAEK
jgi:hypothetical protein